MRRSMTILVGDRQFPRDRGYRRSQLPAGDPAASGGGRSGVGLRQAGVRWCFPKPRPENISAMQSPVGKTIVMSRQQCDASYQNCQVAAQALSSPASSGSAAQHPASGRCDDPQHVRSVAGQPGNARKLGLYQRLGLCPAGPRRRSGCGHGEIQDRHRSLRSIP